LDVALGGRDERVVDAVLRFLRRHPLVWREHQKRVYISPGANPTTSEFTITTPAL
jgi:hypothetical protein